MKHLKVSLKIMQSDKRLRLIGLACRAGKVRAGTFITEKLIKEKNAPLVIIAGDGSEQQTKKITVLAKLNNVEYIVMATKEELGKMVGKAETLSLVITDLNFINGIKSQNGGA